LQFLSAEAIDLEETIRNASTAWERGLVGTIMKVARNSKKEC